MKKQMITITKLLNEIKTYDEDLVTSELIERVLEELRSIKEEYDKDNEQYGTVVKKMVNLAKENEALKKEIEYRKLAEGKYEKAVDYVVDCIKKSTELNKGD